MTNQYEIRAAQQAELRAALMTGALDRSEPPWLVHLRHEHLDLYWVAERLLRQFTKTGEWPKRRVLYAALRHRYETIADMEKALSDLSLAFELREELDCDRRCGFPVLARWVTGLRGPGTWEYSLDPRPDILSKPDYNGLSVPAAGNTFRPLSVLDHEAWSSALRFHWDGSWPMWWQSADLAVKAGYVEAATKFERSEESEEGEEEDAPV